MTSTLRSRPARRQNLLCGGASQRVGTTKLTGHVPDNAQQLIKDAYWAIFDTDALITAATSDGP